LEDKTSAGVSNNFGEIVIGKGAKFNQKNLAILTFLNINPLNWTGEAKTDDLINVLLHNYNIQIQRRIR
jgi:DNA-directed RNA polymerase subunit beta